MKSLIENLPGFEKDRTFGGYGSGATLNKDIEALEIYRKQKNNMRRIDKVEDDISQLRTDINEILNIVRKLH